MNTSKARSNKDKAKEEEERSGIDVPKTRRRIEDTLRKSDPETIIKIAETLGVKVAERQQLPEEIEIVMADVVEELNKILKLTTSVGNEPGISKITYEISNRIIRVLPRRFNIYYLTKNPWNPFCWARTGRYFFTREAAEKHIRDQRAVAVAVEHLNVSWMRFIIADVTKKIQEGETPPLEPDEVVKIRQLKRILYPDRNSTKGLKQG